MPESLAANVGSAPRVIDLGAPTIDLTRHNVGLTAPQSTPTGRRPDFIIIGAQKCATTTIWHHLRNHPDVFLPDWKETNFFLDEGANGRDLAWYEGFFNGQPADVRVGEASPAYTLFPHVGRVAQRMAEVVPNARLIYVIREPIKRMVSSWTQARGDFLETMPLNQALIEKTLYVAGSQYATQLEQYLRHFDRSQIKVMRYEDFAAHTATAMDEICRFISVDPANLSELDARLNVSIAKELPRASAVRARRVLTRVGSQWLATRIPRSFTYQPVDPSQTSISDDVRERILDYLMPDLVRLRALLGPDFDLWGYV